MRTFIIHEEDKKDYSFVVGYHLLRHAKDQERKKSIRSMKGLKVDKQPYVFVFNQLEEIFSDVQKAKRFQEIFTYNTIELPNSYSRKPWRIGFSLSMNLRKIFKLIIKAANLLNIKLES